MFRALLTAWNPYEAAITTSTVGALRTLWTCCETGRRMEVALWQGQVFATNPAPFGELPSPELFSFVSAFDLETGEHRWRAPVGQGGELGGVMNRPAVGYGRLYAQDENRSFTLDTRTGDFAPGLDGLPGLDVASSSPVASRRAVYVDTRSWEGGPDPRRLVAIADTGALRCPSQHRRRLRRDHRRAPLEHTLHGRRRHAEPGPRRGARRR
jgi:outer membrane protein assembly factor BamB